MSKTDSKTIELYDKVRNFFLDRGIDYWDAHNNLTMIDAALILETTYELAGKLTAVQQGKLEKFLDTKPTSEQICLYLGVTEQEFERIHHDKLEQTLNKLPGTFTFSPLQPLL